jgi:dihydropteroate synthase
VTDALHPRALRYSDGSLGGERPAVMAILNVTSDSFFDGGRYEGVERAVARALEVVDEGADCLDIGGESTRPGSDGVSEEQEIARVIPVIRSLMDGEAGPYPIPISVDTSRSEVARLALEAGAKIVNDVTGGTREPDILEVAAEAQAGVILMHMRGTPRSMQVDVTYDDLLSEICDFLLERCAAATEAGVLEGFQAVDPGLGFGKSPQACLEILANLRRFEELTRPLLIGASRKSFIGDCFGHNLSNRLEGSLASAALAVGGGASILRVHDVAATRRTVDVAAGIRGALR